MIFKFFSVGLLFATCFASSFIINELPNAKAHMMLERKPRYVASAVSHSGLRGPADDHNIVVI